MLTQSRCTILGPVEDYSGTGQALKIVPIDHAPGHDDDATYTVLWYTPDGTIRDCNLFGDAITDLPAAEEFQRELAAITMQGSTEEIDDYISGGVVSIRTLRSP